MCSGVLTSSTTEAEYKETLRRQHEYKNFCSGKPEYNDSSWKHPLRDLKKKISGIVSAKEEKRPMGEETRQRSGGGVQGISGVLA